VINSMRFSLAAAALLAAAMVVPGPALAQDSPQFNNWGPGMPPPDDEGVDDGSSSAAGPDSAAPYAAPAPGPIGSGCSYDLRGMWRVQGQWSYGGSSSYSATVSVRQFHRYLQAIQDDGTSYYGMCTGSQVQFDVYSGYQYAGRQYGSFTGSTRRYPDPLSSDAAPTYAVPAPIGGGSQRGSFTWSTWYGSGSETWTRNVIRPLFDSPGP